MPPERNLPPMTLGASSEHGDRRIFGGDGNAPRLACASPRLPVRLSLHRRVLVSSLDRSGRLLIQHLLRRREIAVNALHSTLASLLSRPLISSFQYAPCTSSGAAPRRRDVVDPDREREVHAGARARCFASPPRVTAWGGASSLAANTASARFAKLATLASPLCPFPRMSRIGAPMSAPSVHGT